MVVDQKTQKDLFEADDQIMIIAYLLNKVRHGETWPGIVLEDKNMFKKNPREIFHSENPNFAIVKPRTEESGMWRVIGGDKVVRATEVAVEAGKVPNTIGFKKILKFCETKKPRGYKRSWILEEYRLKDSWNWKKDVVFCRIRFLFQAEICYLVADHLSSLINTKSPSLSLSGERNTKYPVPATQTLPDYGFFVEDQQEEDVYYLETINGTDGNSWPSYVTNDVYRVHPLTLVDPDDEMFADYGTCFYANRTENSGKTDRCDGGYWRIMGGDSVIKSGETGEILGVKRTLKFYEMGEQKYIVDEQVVNVLWTMDEYRLAESVKKNKVLCVIKLQNV